MPFKIQILSESDEPRNLRVSEGQTLLQCLQSEKILITAPCGGQGTCGKCRVQVVENQVAESVLACRYLVTSDIRVELPATEEVRIQSESYFPNLNILYNEILEPEFGIAVDVGTTTVVVFLEDLQNHRNLGSVSFLNPQKAYGADVISRIHYGSNLTGLRNLQEVVLRELDQSIQQLAEVHGIRLQTITQISIVGNTTMLHLLRGVDPSTLAFYPFTPVFLNLPSFSAAELHLHAVPEARVHFLPSLSAYVGADIVAGIAASDMPDEEAFSLFLDIGTNGEMALGNKNQLLCCATAAGPAFEGAKISCGLGGVRGAIHRFSESDYETIGKAVPLGVCGSGLIDVVAQMLKKGQLDPSGYLEQPFRFLPDVQLSLTPQDIREVQLAKGAIAAGIETLIRKAGIEIHQIARVYLAGGFGYAIHPESAIGIGLFPKELEHKIIRAGNTAGLGARLFLHSKDFAWRMEQITNLADHFDLSMDLDFNESFVMNLSFPDHSLGEQ